MQASKAGRCPDPPKAEGLWKPIRFEVGVQRLGPAGFWRSTVLGPPKAAVLGGDDRDRTDDPLLAKQVLSQLSYAPKARSVSKRAPAAQDRRAKRAGPTPKAARARRRRRRGLVGQGGFEPPTPRLSSVCSNQLSY